MRASVATLSCLVQRYCRTATMIKSAAMPDKIAIQKTGNCWVHRWPMPLVLDVDEPCIVSSSTSPGTPRHTRPAIIGPVIWSALRCASPPNTFLAYEIFEFHRFNRGAGEQYCFREPRQPPVKRRS